MKLIKSGNRYILQCAFSEKDIPKNAGMRWYPADRVWATTDSAIAEMLLQYADGSVKAAIVASKAIIAQQITASRATDVSIDVPCPEGLAYLGFQKAGIVYCLRRFGVDLCGISGQDQRTRNATQDPDVLQSGCGISEAENSSRNRRAESPPVETARERPKENGSLAGARMAGTQDKTQIEKGGQYPSRGVLIADEMG